MKKLAIGTMGQGRPTMKFECVACGLCCHNQILPLSIAEAVTWIDNGGVVGLHANILKWDDQRLSGALNPMLEDPQFTDWVKSHTVPGRSGKVRVRAFLQTCGIVEGACHHLKDGMCSIYQNRPNVCRIYPAESSDPADRQEFMPQEKMCPTNAWSTDKPLFLRNGTIVPDRPEALAHDDFHKIGTEETLRLEKIFALIGISTATISADSTMIHRVENEVFISAVKRTHNIKYDALQTENIWWRTFVHNIDMLKDFKRTGFFTTQNAPENSIVIPTRL